YTHSGWIEPKTDWSADDYYNFNDLDRVENNVLYIYDLIQTYIEIPPLVVEKSRTMRRIEFADSLNRIEQNIAILGQRYAPFGWITPKTNWVANDKFDFNDAARLEI